MDFEVTKLPGHAQAQQEEGVFGTVGRTVARGTSRAVESLVGLPGDIQSGLDSALSYVGDKLFGNLGKVTTKEGETIDVNELMKQEKTQGGAGGLVGALGGPSIFDVLETKLPTSEDVRGAIKSTVGKVLPSGYLEPQAEWEKYFDDFVSDAVPLLVPIKGKVPFARSLKIAGLSNLAPWLTKKVGGGEGTQAGAKLGTTLLTSFGNPLSFKKYIKTLPAKEARIFSKELKNTGKLLRFIKKQSTKIINPMTGILFGVYHGKGVPAAVGAGGAYLAGLTERSLKMFSKNPAARRFYLDTMRAAARQNAPLVAKNLGKFDKLMNKEFPQLSSGLPVGGDFEVTKL